jgi:hypothetical protein
MTTSIGSSSIERSYPLSDSAVSHFSANFGDVRDKRDLCAFAFETNPAHKECRLQLQSTYKAMGWMYHPIFAGVSDQAGNLTFWHLNDTGYKKWGFNAFRSDSRWGKGVPDLGRTSSLHYYYLAFVVLTYLAYLIAVNTSYRSSLNTTDPGMQASLH